MRTEATFRSSSFNTSETKSYFINPCCFGDDLARWMMARLRTAGVRTTDEPRQEDFGWYFEFEVPAGKHCCLLGYQEGLPEGRWLLWLERSRGFLGSILGMRKRGIDAAAAQALHDVLRKAPEIRDLEWQEKDPTRLEAHIDSYDPETSRPFADWLQTDEGERIELVSAYHRRNKIHLPNAQLHAVIHVVVENQLALGEEVVVETLARLQREGLSRHDGLHAIGSVLVADVYELMRESSEAPGVAQRRYLEGLQQLTAKKWRAG